MSFLHIYLYIIIFKTKTSCIVFQTLNSCRTTDIRHHIPYNWLHNLKYWIFLHTPLDPLLSFFPCPIQKDSISDNSIEKSECTNHFDVCLCVCMCMYVYFCLLYTYGYHLTYNTISKYTTITKFKITCSKMHSHY